jgi:hypothetical protein
LLPACAEYDEYTFFQVFVDDYEAVNWFKFKSLGAEDVYFAMLQHPYVRSAAYDGDNSVVVAVELSSDSFVEHDVLEHLMTELELVEADPDPDDYENYRNGIIINMISISAFRDNRCRFMEDECSLIFVSLHA